MNAILAEHGGRLPRESGWRSAAHDAGFEHIAEFDNLGRRIEFELQPDPDEPCNVVVQYRKMTKVYAQHTMMSVGFGGHSPVAPSPEAPNLMVGRMNNLLGAAAKSGLYLALPGAAENVRIRRGNGVIDAGTFKFAYAERYVADDESTRLECTYLNR